MRVERGHVPAGRKTKAGVLSDCLLKGFTKFCLWKLNRLSQRFDLSQMCLTKAKRRRKEDVKEVKKREK